MIKGIVFDIDGTILDTSEFILSSFEHTLKTHKLPTLTREELRNLTGPPLLTTYGKLAPDLDPALLVETHRSFQVENLHLSKPFLNTIATLEELQALGIKIAAVTNRSARSSIKTLEAANIHRFFEIVISAEDVKQEKPDPEGLFIALQYINVDANHALMVGDTGADVGAGKAAGVKTVGITHGLRGDDVKQFKPDYLIHNLSELLPIVKSL